MRTADADRRCGRSGPCEVWQGLVPWRLLLRSHLPMDVGPALFGVAAVVGERPGGHTSQPLEVVPPGPVSNIFTASRRRRRAQRTRWPVQRGGAGMAWHWRLLLRRHLPVAVGIATAPRTGIKAPTEWPLTLWRLCRRERRSPSAPSQAGVAWCRQARVAQEQGSSRRGTSLRTRWHPACPSSERRRGG